MQRKSIKKKLKILALPKSCGNDLLDQLYNELSQKNYVIQGWPNGFTIRIIIKQFFLIFLFRPNFVHIHWPEHFFCTSDPIKFAFQKAQFKILKYMGARIIWTVHNLEPHDAIKKKEYQIIMDYLHSVLDGWISQSDPATKLILNKYPNLSNISHSKIPHGHFRNAFPQTSKTKKESLFQLGLPEHSTILLSLGRIEPYKGLVNLAKIFCEINDPNTFLVIAGPGKGTTIEQLKFIALKNKNIRIFNYQIRDEMSIFFRAADLSILPYKAILNSSSAILSLSFNRPLIAPALGSLVELQNQYGREWLRLYHEEINLSILKKEIEKIKNYPIEEKILNLDDIDWKNVAEKTSNFLDKIN